MSGPVELRVKRWRCQWCRRSWSKRATTVSHMETCPHNPAERTCLTCAHAWGSDCRLSVPLEWSEKIGKTRRVPAPYVGDRVPFLHDEVTLPPLGAPSYNVDCPSWVGRARPSDPQETPNG